MKDGKLIIEVENPKAKRPTKREVLAAWRRMKAQFAIDPTADAEPVFIFGGSDNPGDIQNEVISKLIE